MKAALEFIKAHLITLICGLVILISLGVGLWGSSLDNVSKAMGAELSRTQASAIAGLKGSAKNEDVIAKEKLRAQYLKQDYDRTVATAQQFNQRAPLMTGVFPKAEAPAARFAFKSAYGREVGRLPGLMNAESLPGPDEFQEEARNVSEARDQIKEDEDETKIDKTKSGKPAATPPSQAGPVGEFDNPRGGGRLGGLDGDFGGSGGGARFGSADGLGPRGGGGSSFSSGGGIDRTVEPRFDPKYRAFVSKARNIRAYIDGGTFHVSPVINETGAPTPQAMWYAQVGLWIQEDVVRAINGLNKEFADKITDAEPNVEHVPVKRLQNLRVLGYQLDGGKLLTFPAAGESLEMGRITPAFSDAKSNELYDVVRFEFTAVVDQREVLKLVDRVTRANFNKLLSIEYEHIDRDNEEKGQGYFYGTAPVVRVRMEFETYMLRDVFDTLKPPEVVADLSGKKPGE